MNLEQILSSPESAWVYAERYVNDGSPSGYDKINTVSANYRSTGPAHKIVVPVFCFGESVLLLYGTDCAKQIPITLGGVPVHPDMARNTEMSARLAEQKQVGALECIPTSSQRTLFVIESGQPKWCIKLHYDALLGRFPRPLDLRRICASMSVNLDLERSHHLFPQRFSHLQETMAVWTPLYDGDQRGFGAVVRSITPYPIQDFTAMIPLFSVFSQDLRAMHEPIVLAQLLNRNAPFEDFIDNLITPLLTSYIFLSSELGLVPEWNAQNLLVTISHNGHISGIVMRDLQGTYRDIEYRPSWLPTISPGAYKVLNAGMSREHTEKAQRQRSFLYDFKLGDYVLTPLVHALHKEFGIDTGTATERIKCVAQDLMNASKLSSNYFPPKGAWFKQRAGVSSKKDMFILGDGTPKYR